MAQLAMEPVCLDLDPLITGRVTTGGGRLKVNGLGHRPGTEHLRSTVFRVAKCSSVQELPQKLPYNNSRYNNVIKLLTILQIVWMDASVFYYPHTHTHTVL